MKRSRNICGMTQAELAGRVGVTTNYISHIEIGSGSVSVPLLLKLCTLLNTTPNDILFGEFSVVEGTVVNIEFDVFGKYVARLFEEYRKQQGNL